MKAIIVFGLMCIAVISGYIVVYIAPYLLYIPVNIHSMWMRCVIIAVGIACFIAQPYVVWTQYGLRRYVFVTTLLGVFIAAHAIMNFKNCSCLIVVVPMIAGVITFFSYSFGKYVYDIMPKKSK
jgi:hypothetical protein